MEGLWRGWCFVKIGMKKLQDILDEVYVLLYDRKILHGI